MTARSSSSVFSMPVRVYYEDTDAGGIVYYVNYLKFMERARTEMLRNMGSGQQTFLEQGMMFVVRDAKVGYHRPARLDDEVQVTAAITRAGRASLVFEQTVCREKQLLCSGCFTVACVEARRMKPVALPDACKQYLARCLVLED